MGYGSIVFWSSSQARTSRMRSDSDYERRISGRGGVLWAHVTDPLTVKRFVEEFVNVSTQQKRQEDYRMMAETFAAYGAKPPATAESAPASRGSTPCPPCGSPADSTLAFCGHCGARLSPAQASVPEG